MGGTGFSHSMSLNDNHNCMYFKSQLSETLTLTPQAWYRCNVCLLVDLHGALKCMQIYKCGLSCATFSDIASSNLWLKRHL